MVSKVLGTLRSLNNSSLVQTNGYDVICRARFANARLFLNFGRRTCYHLHIAPNLILMMAAVDFVTEYITNYVDGMVRPYVAQGAAAVGDVAGGVLFSVCALSKRFLLL